MTKKKNREAVENKLECWQTLNNTRLIFLGVRMSKTKTKSEYITASDLVGMGLGSRPTIRRIIERTDFPRPLPLKLKPRIWHRGDVEAWLERARANALRD